MATRIITDSASDIVDFPNPNLTVLPMTVAFGDTVYHDGVDLTHERLFDLLVESDELPTTGAVSPGVFAQAYDEAREAGEDVVVVTLSSKVSATCQSARLAAEGRGDVHVVDSLNACIGERVLVEYALMLAERGLPAADIAAQLERARSRVHMLALLDTLEYLRRGGRIGSAAAAAGALLALKPVITMANGEVELLGKARGSKNARNLLVELVKEHPIDFAMPFSLACTAGGEAMLKKYVRDSSDLWEGIVDALPICSVGATIGTHVGPGAIAVAYFERE
ncbi:DegV family protein [Parafannyhessea umbonata]|uniref:DegV family protein n=1 Tax=Parafannyhessea umbonata TaxID=604330 RepID=UPI0026E9DEB3|nr:DegV family protein [Parafannyhessea umbonata]MCI6682100.1 DegV family protein [Parafannyhessea umbonata]MCI7218368.1 DegV family protein [Parafannyhessea umbonata]